MEVFEAEMQEDNEELAESAGHDNLHFTFYIYMCTFYYPEVTLTIIRTVRRVRGTRGVRWAACPLVAMFGCQG